MAKAVLCLLGCAICLVGGELGKTGWWTVYSIFAAGAFFQSAIDAVVRAAKD